MSEYKVVKADHKKDFLGQRGEMSVYVLTLDEGSGSGITEQAELCQMRKTDPPVPGETISGQIIPADNPDWLPRFKKDYTPSSGGGGKGFRTRDPAEIAGARHAHSLLVAAHSFSPLPLDAHPNMIQGRIENLEAFALELDERTKQASQVS